MLLKLLALYSLVFAIATQKTNTICYVALQRTEGRAVAKISGLVKVIADMTGIPHSVVSLYARRLTDAGLLPKSRGRRYAQASPEHAAVLIIAMLSTDHPADAPRNVQKYAFMTFRSRQFLSFMASLIDGASRLDKEIWRLLSFSEFCFERKPDEWIIFRDNFTMDVPTIDTAWFASKASTRKKPDKKQCITIETSLGGQALCIIGAFFANVSYRETVMELVTHCPEVGLDIDNRATLVKLLPEPRRPAEFD